MEVDTNSQLIQLVHSRPILYSKSCDFHGRIHQWKEIADILKVEVSLVKSRWHLLRTKFLMEYSSELKGKRTTFKYFNDMSFLVDHTNMIAFEMLSKQNELSAEPEFVIEKKDLDDESDDDSSQIFMELDIDEGTNKHILRMTQSDLTGDMSEVELDETIYLPNEEFTQNHQLVKVPKYKIGSQHETFHLVEVTEKEDSAAIVIKESSEEKSTQSVETKINLGDVEKPCSVQEKVDSVEQVKKPVSEDSEESKCASAQPERDRCEDTIFGELVTATLRKMQTDKKRAVKREIMNILFT